MLTATELKTLLRTHGLRLTKRLGQHHLIDARTIERLMACAQITHDETVVEIGAGLGALTESLAKRAARVIAVEVDRPIAALLAERMAAYPNVDVRCQDILDFSWECQEPVTVVGAIPYHITSPIIVWLCQARRTIRRAILIVQHEVAQRLIAKPETKAYGRLSVLGQYCWELSVLLSVPRSAFFPQPDVESSCLQLQARTQPRVLVKDEVVFFDVVKAAFSQRRKTLANCLRAATSSQVRRVPPESLLKEIGLPATIRGETLSLEQFAALANALARAR